MKDYRLVENREFFKCEKKIYEKAFLDVESFFEKYKTQTEMFNYFFKNSHHPIMCLNLSKKYNKTTNIKEEIINNVLTKNLINQYIEDNADNKQCIEKYNNIILFKNYFKIDDEELVKYINLFTNSFTLVDYFNFIKILKNNKNTYEKTELFNDDKKYRSDNELKIKIIKCIFDTHNLKYLSFDCIDKANTINITDKEHKIICYMFRSKKEKPNNGIELKKMLIDMLNNVIGYVGVVKNKRISVKGNKIYKYCCVIDKVNFYLKLYKKRKNIEFPIT